MEDKEKRKRIEKLIYSDAERFGNMVDLYIKEMNSESINFMINSKQKMGKSQMQLKMKEAFKTIWQKKEQQ